jgi:kinetochore protein Nuf2
VDHFSVQDVSRPDGARLRKIISIIRNLLAFRGERGDFMTSVVQKMDDAKLQEEELLAIEEQLKQEKGELL